MPREIHLGALLPCPEDDPLARTLQLLCVAALTTALSMALPQDAIAQGASDTSLVQLGDAQAGTRAFVAWSAGGKSAPALVLVHDWWGLNPQIRRVARTLARQGYIVITPDLYRGGAAADVEAARRMAGSIDREQALADLDLAVAWLRSQKRTRESRIAVLGFNVGGRLAQRMAMQSDELAAVVMFHATAQVDQEQLRRLRVPLLAHFAAEDIYVDVALAGQLRSGMEAAGKPGRVYVYQGAEHGFMSEALDQYHPDAAKLAWARTRAFLQSTLKGEP